MIIKLDTVIHESHIYLRSLKPEGKICDRGYTRAYFRIKRQKSLLLFEFHINISLKLDKPLPTKPIGSFETNSGS